MAHPTQTFLAMSAVLTGIDETKLASPPALAAAYYQKAQAEAGAALADLLALYVTVSGKTSDPVAIGKALFGSAPATSFLARSIILEWYLGMWYDPASLQAYASSPDTAQPVSSVISPLAYKHGWAWTIAQAHPMGFSTFDYGYWNAPPQAVAGARR